MREWRKNNPDKVKANNKRCYWKDHKHTRLRSKQNLERLRESLFVIMGHECVQCGFSDKRALQFDHIDGGGNQEVKKFKSNTTMLRYYRDRPAEMKDHFQILCANCNRIKAITHNENVSKYNYQ